VGDRNDFKYILAHIPLDEMFGYTTHLRSATQGRGYYTMEFLHHAPVPTHVYESLIKNREKIQTEALYG
jgi:elongation factor G